MIRRHREFGFICPAFSVGLSGNGFLLPQSRAQLLRRSLIAGASTRQLMGRYLWQIHCDGEEFWRLPVVVAWARHRSQAEPFLAIKAAHVRLVRQQLQPLAGRDVALSFTPRLAPLR